MSVVTIDHVVLSTRAFDADCFKSDTTRVHWLVHLRMDELGSEIRDTVDCSYDWFHSRGHCQRIVLFPLIYSSSFRKLNILSTMTNESPGFPKYSIYQSSIDYTVAAYGPYAASATGGNDFARDFLSGLAALYSVPRKFGHLLQRKASSL